ncbi:MAG: PGRP and LysM peptidoglycan-binding domain-containing protein [Planctomycetota bacterium]|jgi:hypothetical protein
MAHRAYKVKPGDCISSIADKYGLFPDDVWNDSRNDKLKKERKDSNVLMPDDVVYVREKEEKEESCASEERHRFRKKGVPEKLIIQFKLGDEPRADEDYVLDIDGSLSEGKTDKDGRIEVWIPPGARKGRIEFRDEGGEYDLDLGRLDPISAVSGVQGRLGNLGFYSGPVDGKASGELEQAIRDFKASQNPMKEADGTLDDDTRKMIEKAHGG